MERSVLHQNMHLTLVPGGRKTAVAHSFASFAANTDSRRHPSPMVQQLVAMAREQLPQAQRSLSDRECRLLAVDGILAILDHLCNHLNLFKDLVGHRTDMAHGLAKIVAQLEDRHA
ncbi:hypothetical protein Despr_0211 [Desulfobulbus propionicus DSM 2032]|uniref:Uncharacterized protein n=1 Tax=Desulfobulbus propionicus (strain ATCC 33891 / DSM 2032 / VKM B-1956 / 1pr3) TaxID=577650 RepID=A0A7U3YJ93_DESPD|nr:hypothetical protein [Desulfobulbus propionicus]ADW16399.1 hypothetical protein Despr_0211 [Desulfobulbus propionicus DSM 2032]